MSLELLSVLLMFHYFVSFFLSSVSNLSQIVQKHIKLYMCVCISVYICTYMYIYLILELCYFCTFKCLSGKIESRTEEGIKFTPLFQQRQEIDSRRVMIIVTGFHSFYICLGTKCFVTKVAVKTTHTRIWHVRTSSTHWCWHPTCALTCILVVPFPVSGLG